MLNWTGTIAKYFVNEGKLTFLLTLSISIFGLIAFILTPKQYNPTIVAPAFEVTIDYPGASKEEILEQVTKPLENVLGDIPGVEDIFSVTTRGGRAVVHVNFYVGENEEQAKISLNDRIQSDMSFAPQGIAPPQISSVDPENVPIMLLALSSTKKDGAALRKFAFRLKNRLSSLAGVSRLSVIGGDKQELAILLNQERLAYYGIDVSLIERVLRSANLFQNIGHIKEKDQWLPLEANAKISTAQELANLIVVSQFPVNIRLKDVATIEEKTEETESYVRLAGLDGYDKDEHRNTVLLSMAKVKGQNIAVVAGDIKEAMAGLEAGFIPGDITVSTIIDDGRVAKREINTLLTNLITAIGIVAIILLLFLNFKAAVLVAVAIPLTLFGVFGLSYLADQNINRITLFALILSLGLLVDNATVVIENIVRILSAKEKTEAVKTSIVGAVNEVGPGLFMSTLTTVIAFLPMRFISGMMGPYMGPIPFFVPAALIISLLISFSINPWLAGIVFKENGEDKPAAPEAKSKDGGFLIKWYEGLLNKTIATPHSRKRTLIIIMSLLVLSAALPGVGLVRFRMLPKANVEQFYVYADLPFGASLDRTLAVTRALEDGLLDNKNVKTVQSTVAEPPILDFNGLFRGVAARRLTHQTTLRVNLTDKTERDLMSEEIVLELRPALTELLEEDFPDLDIKLKLVEDPPGPPVRSTVLVKIQGRNETLMAEVTDDLFDTINETEGVVDTDKSILDNHTTIQLKLKHAEAAKSNISPAQIIATLEALYAGKVIGTYHNADSLEQQFIRLQMEAKYRTDKDYLKQIKVVNAQGIRIPVSRFVEIEKRTTDLPLHRENKKTTDYLYGDMQERSVTYAGIDILGELYDYRPQAGFELEDFDLFGATYKHPETKEEIQVLVGGEWELTLEVFRDLGIAMGFAVFLIYFLLVGQFKSFSLPLIIMSSIPLSVIGVFPGMMVLYLFTGEYFTATSMIGIIALAGIAVNNSIILLEYVYSLYRQDMELKEALVMACRTRFRPIMLTTITTMLGSLTIINDPVWSGLAYAVILGLGMSSLLILIVFPVLMLQFPKGMEK